MNTADPFHLGNKNIVVTGASSGLGRATVLALVSRGANVFMIARSEEKLDSIIEYANATTDLRKIVVDLTHPDATTRVVEVIRDSGYKIDGFVHSAGDTATVPLRNTSKEGIQQLNLLNVASGVELAGKLSTRQIANSTGASFVFIASVMGLTGEIGKTCYSLSKGAIIAGVKSMALELASKRIRVNCISPGVVLTPMVLDGVYAKDDENFERVKQQHPLGIGDPSDIANACVFLLSDASKWITGTNIIIDGGYTAK